MSKADLVFVPTPGVGHLVATLELAKLLVGRDEQLSVTVLVMNLTSDNSKTRAFIESAASSPAAARIRFIELPPSEIISFKGTSPFLSMISPIDNQKSQVREAVAKLTQRGLDSGSSRLAGFVIDMFCTSMIDVGNEFGLPTYVFFTSNASCLGVMFHILDLQDEHKKEFCEFAGLDTQLNFPGFAKPLPAKLLPSEALDAEDSQAFLGLATRFKETKGILVNTFVELEPRVMTTIFGDRLPPVYGVGPILSPMGGKSDARSSDIIKWLDEQPPASVVFLCFGSMGTFGEDQVREIAKALEGSGLRFLWSLRQPPPKGKNELPREYANPEEVLPDGFLDRTSGIGKVIGWAPQVEVLAHPAVSGFVSHCGWNSTLESIWYGVPTAAWPMYAEQQFNAFATVLELGIAVEIRMDYRKDPKLPGYRVPLVTAEEIEITIRRLMEAESPERRRVKEMSEVGRRAIEEEGSSYLNLGRFISSVLDNMP